MNKPNQNRMESMVAKLQAGRKGRAAKELAADENFDGKRGGARGEKASSAKLIPPAKVKAGGGRGPR